MQLLVIIIAYYYYYYVISRVKIKKFKIDKSGTNAIERQEIHA